MRVGEIEADDVLELLSRLVETSLVVAEEQNDAQRYRLLETVRQYGQEQLQIAEEDVSARENHLRYFLALAEEAEPQLIEATQAQWLQTLEAEHDNLRASLAWAVAGDTRLRLAGALWRFWLTRYITEGRGWLEGALAGSRGASEAVRAKALNALGVLATRQSDYNAARPLLDESLAIRRRSSDICGTAECLNNLAQIERSQDNKIQAQSLYEECLTLYRLVNDKWGMAGVLINLGTLARDNSDPDQAEKYYKEGLLMCRAIGDVVRTASASANLAILAIDQKNYLEAYPLLEESLLDFRKLDHQMGIAITLHNMGIVIQDIKGIEHAIPCFIESIEIRARIGEAGSLHHSLNLFAQIAAQAGCPEYAVQLLGAADALRPPSAPVTTAQQEERTGAISQLRQTLGEQAFDDAWSQGQGCDVSQSVERAIMVLTHLKQNM